MNESNDFLKERKCQKKSQNGLSRFLTAIVFIAAGGLLIAQRTGMISPELFHQLFNWQMLIIGIGLITISNNKNSIGGLVMVLVGLVFLAPLYFKIPVDTQQLLWPVVLVGIGIIMLFNGLGKIGANFRLKFTKSGVDDVDMLDGNHIFGGGEYYITSENFKGGKINAVFGGGTYNLTRCKLADGVNVLDVSLIFGGVEILVPSDWQIKVEVDSILGGFSDKGAGYISNPQSTGTLIIRGTAIFGGGELKRV